jgi:hypothetical protein
MDRIFLKLALPHFRHYQQQSLRRAPLSAWCAPIFCIENCGRDPLEFVSRSLARKNPGSLRLKPPGFWRTRRERIAYFFWLSGVSS